MDFELTVFEQNLANPLSEPQAQSIKALICPSDQGGGLLFRQTPSKFFSKGNYAAYASPMHIEHAKFFAGAFGGFEPGSKQGQTLRKIKDGTTKTIGVTEVRARATEERDPRGVWALPWPASTVLSLDFHDDDTQSGYQPDVGYNPDSIQTPNHQMGINDQIRPCVRPVQATLEGMPCTSYQGWSSASPRSRHTGGVNAVAMDGHVGFISDDVDPYEFALLISVDDGLTFDLSNTLK